MDLENPTSTSTPTPTKRYIHLYYGLISAELPTFINYNKIYEMVISAIRLKEECNCLSGGGAYRSHSDFKEINDYFENIFGEKLINIFWASLRAPKTKFPLRIYKDFDEINKKYTISFISLEAKIKRGNPLKLLEINTNPENPFYF